MKKISALLVVVVGITLFFLLHAPERKINAEIVFINQVRGLECCQKGSLEFTRQQLELFKKYKFAATFVLRYDALIDNAFINLFKSYAKNRFDYGIFFEITPRLAKDAGVAYKGSQERWYRASYAYLVGYSQEDRKKLIDTVMTQFKREFGSYPKTTSGWMIDTFSANYLSNTYGVTTHEITREQWGTDGYALYGGSVPSLYNPSKEWVFIPAQSTTDSLPLRILRQTVSDPVRNYGDLTSGYTSQPNDYGRTKSFDYFKHLLGQVEQSSQPIAILGLENSLEKKYQDIYEKQIAYVGRVIDKNNIIFPREIGNIKKQNFVFGTDFENKKYSAYWIQTTGYRARIIVKDDYVQLTDLRIYAETMKDPYFSTPSGEKTAFWEAPYVFDSSKNGVHKALNALSVKTGELFRFFGNEDWIRERTNPVVNEQFLREINGIVFPQLKNGMHPSITEKDGIIILRYTQQNGTEIMFIFSDNAFIVKGVEKNGYQIKGSIGQNTKLTQEQKNDSVFFTPLLVSEEQSGQSTEGPQNKTAAHPSEVTIIYNAPFSLMGRNPARIVVVSKDSGSNPARIQNLQITHTKGNFDSVKIHETEGHLGEFDGMYYVDIEENTSGTYTPVLTFDSQKQTLLPLSFVLDCKKNIKTCLLNPQKLIDYVKVKIGDVLNRR
ncbi:MAG: hypothetical protein V1922_05990 [bacterium]